MLDDVDQVHFVEQGAPIQVHPYSVMEYWDGATRLLDFVYATAETSDSGFRGRLTQFFEQYRTANDREGTYLTAADISEPMWEPTFSSPEEMRRDKHAQLRLIQRRIEDVLRGTDVTEALVKRLSLFPDATDLKRLSAKAGIQPQRWWQGGTLADEAARLVEAAYSSGKHQALLHAIQYEDR